MCVTVTSLNPVLPPNTRGSVAERLRKLLEDGDAAAVAVLVEQHPLESWYAVPPAELLMTLASVPPELLARHSIVAALLAATGSLRPDPGRDAESDTAAAAERTEPRQPWSVRSAWLREVPRTFVLRMSGRTREALALTRRLAALGPLPTPDEAVFGSSGGWESFVAVQNGVTAMLAGDFGFALASFASAAVINPSAELAFLRRDAHVCAAVAHALYGDLDIARAELSIAAQVPRTGSWAEPVIDAKRAVAEALLEPDPAEGEARLALVSPHTLGEMWSHYVYARVRILRHAGRLAEASRYLDSLELAKLPGADGDGFQGGAMVLTRAAVALDAGELRAARELLDGAEEALFVTGFVRAQLELRSGQPRRALALARQLEPETRPLRRAEIARQGIIAEALLATGEQAASTSLLLRLASGPERIRAREAALLSATVQRHAIATVPGWPQHEVVQLGSEANGSGTVLDAIELTRREHEVLELLVAGSTRDEIAAALFVSSNTVKSHQRSLYRKLGVSSRSELVQEVIRRGLLG